MQVRLRANVNWFSIVDDRKIVILLVEQFDGLRDHSPLPVGRMSQVSSTDIAFHHPPLGFVEETVLDEIKQQFPIEKIQYVCVAQETGSFNGLVHLHIQIILKYKANKKSWFLDDITGTHCNYQVTNNDLAWNEYIKKGTTLICCLKTHLFYTFAFSIITLESRSQFHRMG
jgi:hypothetical protein